MSDQTIHIDDNEYQALKLIDEYEESSQAKAAPSQRDIAKALNMSVGMTNAIIKRLAAKGWLVINKVNGRNLSYALTPEGTKEVARRSYRYLRRTIGNVVRWKDAIDAEVRKAKEAGCSRVLLVGDSDLDFIVEHAANRHGLVFVRSFDVDAEKYSKNSALILFSERKDISEGIQYSEVHYVYLSNLLLPT
ncbi:winged helix-turn-helix transcriptional regulator [Salinispira pacifica]|uniref:Winged helix-turn-helix transcriptional regulator n=1 Tax=Salinispira pacifica TaxID=1307761 RepID=V5WLJ2_9SPIO|nr:winged helix-turn-helix transcriptional regulator [Salinispira pacifica]AHC16494.1 hypothetical protein L21SP2_3154 [Salinispira pacifica]